MSGITRECQSSRSVNSVNDAERERERERRLVWRAVSGFDGLTTWIRMYLDIRAVPYGSLSNYSWRRSVVDRLSIHHRQWQCRSNCTIDKQSRCVVTTTRVIYFGNWMRVISVSPQDLARAKVENKFNYNGILWEQGKTALRWIIHNVTFGANVLSLKFITAL